MVRDKVRTFLERPIEGEWLYLWIDATYVKVRQEGQIVSVAVTLAVGVDTDGRREVLGMRIGASEAEPFWTAFLRKLAQRGLKGVKLVISFAGKSIHWIDYLSGSPHKGIQAAVTRMFTASWQRCRVRFMRNVLANAGRQGRGVAAAFIGLSFAQESAGAAKLHWRNTADQLRPKVPKLAAMMDEAETDVLACMGFAKEHWTRLHSTNPLERLNGEIKRRADVVGIFPNEDAITRLVGAILLEQNDEWAEQRTRHMTLATIATMADDPLVSLSAMAA